MKDKSLNGERNQVEQWWKWGEKRQESDCGHFVKSLNERAMIDTTQEEFKLALKKKQNINSGTSI